MNISTKQVEELIMRCEIGIRVFDSPFLLGECHKALSALVQERNECRKLMQAIVDQYDASPDGPLGKGFTNGPFLHAREYLQRG